MKVRVHMRVLVKFSGSTQATKRQGDFQWKYPGGTYVFFSESFKPQALYAANLRELCGRNELWMEAASRSGINDQGLKNYVVTLQPLYVQI